MATFSSRILATNLHPELYVENHANDVVLTSFRGEVSLWLSPRDARILAELLNRAAEEASKS